MYSITITKNMGFQHNDADLKKKKKKKSSSLFVHLFYGGACQVAQDVSFALTVCGPPELGLPEHTAMPTKDSSSYNGDYQ